ncbi:MAG: aminotransferase class IV [Treponema sp.]|jgi:D-alanine transaminase|nr:aminotransferase class IV [Treponema sp.]
MKTLGYYNGEIAPVEEMRVPMNDRACFFGDGVYEAAICLNYKIFTLDEHIDRMWRSASLLKMDVPLSRGDMTALLEDLIKKLDSPDLLVYWQLSRGTAPRAHVFPGDVKPNLWVTIKPLVLPDIYAKVSLITVPDKRFFFCNIKTLNLIPNVLASEEARQAGCHEAVFHRDGRVTECSHSNVHILKDGVFRTAPPDNLILPGISRAHLISHAKALGIRVEEKAFTLEEMMDADEIITSSTTAMCMGAEKIDNKNAGGKAPALLKSLQDAFLEELREKTQ